jgi:hypothetical protein
MVHVAGSGITPFGTAADPADAHLPHIADVFFGVDDNAGDPLAIGGNGAEPVAAIPDLHATGGENTPRLS